MFEADLGVRLGFPRCRSLIREGQRERPIAAHSLSASTAMADNQGPKAAKTAAETGYCTIEIVELCTWHAISSPTPNRRRFDPSHHVGIMPKRLVANSRSVARRCR
jgi:hypothetical protein